jgi:hypothetical protein
MTFPFINLEYSMTFRVLIAVATQTIAVSAAAAAAANYQARILNGNGEVVQQQQQATPTFEAFTGIPAGDYTAEVSRLDVNGAVIGTAVTQSFSTGAEVPAPAPDVSVDVPASLTITVTQE